MVSIGRCDFAELGQTAAALALPHVVFPQFLLMLFHLGFNFGEGQLRAGANVAALACGVECAGGQREV